MKKLRQLQFQGIVLIGFFLLALPGWGGEAPWKPAKKEGVFLLLSDIHFDPYADPVLVPQLQQAPVEEWDNLFSGAVKPQMASYGKDPNFLLFLSTLAAVQGTGLHYDYALVTGDFISHHFRENFKKSAKGGDKEYQAFVLKTVEYVTQKIQKSLGGAPAYFCLGNNDSDCDDYGGLTAGTPFLPILAKDWATVAQDPEAAKTFTQGGYYTVSHPTLANREFVVFNDVSWSAKYNPSCATGDVGMEEMTWLKRTLQHARDNHKRVILLTHMPPGVNGRNASEHSDRTKPQKTFYGQNFLWPFLNILAPYRDIIDAEFCGHTHMDDFRVVQDRGGKAVLFAHLSPAVSPVRNNNPAFQAILYDKRTGAMRDMATYYLSNLLTASPTEAAKWELEYDFDEAYGFQSYDSASLLSLAKGIETDPAIRAKYIQYVPVSSTHDPPCTLADWKFFACALLNLDPASYMECYR